MEDIYIQQLGGEDQARNIIYQRLQEMPANKREAVFRMAAKYQNENVPELPEQLDTLSDDFFLLAEVHDCRPYGGSQHGRLVNMMGLTIGVDLTSCIREAISINDLEAVRIMLRNGVDIPSIEPTALIGAAKSHSRAMITLLISQTYDPSLGDFECLRILATEDQKESLELLLNHFILDHYPAIYHTLLEAIIDSPRCKGLCVPLLINKVRLDLLPTLLIRAQNRGMSEDVIQCFAARNVHV
jgi:hypothetical protein